MKSDEQKGEPAIDSLVRPPFRFVTDERGAVLWRYAVVIALAALACVLAFTTVGQEVVQRVWVLSEKIGQA